MRTTEQAVGIGRRRRRRHSQLFKAEAVGACLEPGVSLAAVALDASHVNNPLGGMGMNGGLHDAFNLAGKLHSILASGGDKQRRGIYVKFIQEHTIQNKKLVEKKPFKAAPPPTALHGNGRRSKAS